MRWTEAELAQYLARFKTPAPANPAVQPAHVEPDPIDEPPRADSTKANDSQFSIRIHSRRRRLADPDGISGKAVIDGLVAGGLLRDDSAKTIKEVSYSQEKSEVEETVIEIWEDE